MNRRTQTLRVMLWGLVWAGGCTPLDVAKLCSTHLDCDEALKRCNGVYCEYDHVVVARAGVGAFDDLSSDKAFDPWVAADPPGGETFISDPRAQTFVAFSGFSQAWVADVAHAANCGSDDALARVGRPDCDTRAGVEPQTADDSDAATAADWVRRQYEGCAYPEVSPGRFCADTAACPWQAGCFVVPTGTQVELLHAASAHDAEPLVLTSNPRALHRLGDGFGGDMPLTPVPIPLPDEPIIDVQLGPEGAYFLVRRAPLPGMEPRPAIVFTREQGKNLPQDWEVRFLDEPPLKARPGGERTVRTPRMNTPVPAGDITHISLGRTRVFFSDLRSVRSILRNF